VSWSSTERIATFTVSSSLDDGDNLKVHDDQHTLRLLSLERITLSVSGSGVELEYSISSARYGGNVEETSEPISRYALLALRTILDRVESCDGSVDGLVDWVRLGESLREALSS